MNDYLTNLIARSLNRAPEIQPRLPSVFEPSALVSDQPGIEPKPHAGHSTDDAMTLDQRKPRQSSTRRQDAPIIQPPSGQGTASQHETNLNIDRDTRKSSPTPLPESRRSSSELIHAVQPKYTVRSPMRPPHETSAGKSLQHTNTAHPAPVIRVTIGRIDVRAVLPPAQPPRQTTPARPKLTLDEYLKQRNGGRR